jgi:hypothetical protein
MTVLMEQHERWKGARSRLGVQPPPAKPIVIPPPPEPKPRWRRLFVKPILDMGTIPPDAFKSRWRRILDQVAEAYNLKPSDITGPCRARPNAAARRELCYRMHAELKMSQSQIGERVGFRDHSTIHHSIQRYREENGL